MTTQTDLERDVGNLLLCATNEGDLYARLLAMGAAVTVPDSDWATEARNYAARLRRERRYTGSHSAATINAFAFQLRDTYIEKAREAEAYKHNADVNPDWTPKVAKRVYACKQCDAEQSLETNHTGTVFTARCVGSCRQIFNAHTAREFVTPYHGPHRYVREDRG